MKYIIVGLGSFGASLAEKLTEQGHEVIGIDTNMSLVEGFKERITHTICMDVTDEFTVSGLPLKDTDIVVITIGENKGTNIMATAVFKNLQAKRIISRAIDVLHEKVLHAVGVTEIVHPEAESAERWAKKLSLKNVIDSFELSEEYSIVEVKTPTRYDGNTIQESNIREQYNLLILTSIESTEERTFIGKTRKKLVAKGPVKATDKLYADNILVVFGSNKQIKKFVNDI